MEATTRSQAVVPDAPLNYASTHETVAATPDHAQDLNSDHFSHLFPAHLYLNRESQANRAQSQVSEGLAYDHF